MGRWTLALLLFLMVEKPRAGGVGLCLSVWNNMSLSGTACSMGPGQPAFDFFNSGPDAGACGRTVDRFSLRFSGELEAPASGRYVLYPSADDGVRLWIKDPDSGQERLLVNRWQDQCVTEFAAPIPFDLEGGRRYPLRMEMYEHGGQAVAELRWEGPGIGKQLIPVEHLYPSVDCGLPPSEGTGPLQARPSPKIPSRQYARFLAVIPEGSRQLTATFPLDEDGHARLLLWDVAGQQLSSWDLGFLQAGDQRQVLDAPALSPGFYFLALQQEQGFGWQGKSLFKLALKPH